MQGSYWGYWLIVLGIFVIVIMMILQSVTTSSTQDYYLIKEVTEAAMIDAVDMAYYTNYSEIRIHKEKFVESFLRRFSETLSFSTTYTIEFFDIYEAPPKVSIRISSTTRNFSVGEDITSFDLVTKLDAILEQQYYCYD